MILASVWLILGTVVLINNEFSNWTDYFWILMAFVYIAMYTYENINQYLSIDNGEIKLNQPFGKKISLNEIRSIKRFAGDYILKTEKEEMTINTQIIEPKSLNQLNEELERLSVKWE